MFYYSTPNYSVALNAKVGSSSMARAIIRQFYPERDLLIRGAAYPAGKSEHTRLWHWMCAGKLKPDKPIVLLVRDPLSRFLSACQQVGVQQKDLDAALDSLINDAAFVRSPPPDVPLDKWTAYRAAAVAQQQRRNAVLEKRGIKTPRPDKLRDDVHFLHQHKYAVGPTTCFRFPQDLDAAAKFIGLKEPMPEANKARREKAQLTPEQKAAVLQYYTDDQKLFDSITGPGYVYTPPETTVLCSSL